LRQLTANLLDASRRALVTSDLTAGRLALRRALDADLGAQDLVYVALWTRLLHERLGAASDGTVEEALAGIPRNGSWVSALRDWARGALTDEALLHRASSEVERVEAQFYAVVRSHFRKQTSSTRAALSQVAQSRAIELIEVRIARELLATGGEPKPVLPKGVQIP
jgi:hypothetical protein